MDMDMDMDPDEMPRPVVITTSVSPVSAQPSHDTKTSLPLPSSALLVCAARLVRVLVFLGACLRAGACVHDLHHIYHYHTQTH